MAISVGNSGSNSSTSAGSNIACDAFTVSAGQTIIVFVGVVSSPVRTVTGVTDTAGNTYTQVASYSPYSVTREYWYVCASSAAQTNNVITATFSGSASILRAIAASAFNGTATAGPIHTDWEPTPKIDTSRPFASNLDNTTADNVWVLGGSWAQEPGSSTYAASGVGCVLIVAEPNIGCIVYVNAASAGGYTISTTSTGDNLESSIWGIALNPAPVAGGDPLPGAMHHIRRRHR